MRKYNYLCTRGHKGRTQREADNCSYCSGKGRMREYLHQCPKGHKHIYKKAAQNCCHCRQKKLWAEGGSYPRFSPSKYTMPEHVHPLVRFMFKEAFRQRCVYTELAKKSGVNVMSIRGWKARVQPSLVNLEACLNSLGYDLVAIKRVTLIAPKEKKYANTL